MVEMVPDVGKNQVYEVSGVKNYGIAVQVVPGVKKTHGVRVFGCGKFLV